VTIAEDPDLSLPITWTKDCDHRFKVESLALDRESYKSTGGDILPNDVITTINGEALYGPKKSVVFTSKDGGFTLKDLRVVAVVDGKQAHFNDISLGMSVCEFDRQVVTSDKQFNELLESTDGKDVRYTITFDNVAAEVSTKTLEAFITEFKKITYPAELEFLRWVPAARVTSTYYSSCGTVVCGMAPA